jgi:hypothetical protein
MAKEISMEIMAIGKWNGFKFDTNRLKTIAKNFKKLIEVHSVPLKIGHAEDQIGNTKSEYQHALGWADDVWVTAAGKLMAKFIDVPEVVYKAVQKKLYRKVSVELDFDVKYKGKDLGDVLSGVALLGADIPAVNTINDLQAFFSDSGNIAGSRKASFCTIETDYEHEEDKTMPISKEDFEKLQSQMNTLSTNFATQQVQLTELSAENTTLKAENAQFKKDEETRKENEKKEKIKFARESATKILDDGVKEKHITPAERENFSKMLQIEDDEAVQKVDLDLLKSMVGKGSSSFSTSSTAKDNGNAEEKNEMAADEEMVVEVSKVRATNPGMSFSAAQSMVFQANPDLARRYIEFNDQEV